MGAIAAFLYWQNYRRSPQYSLATLAHAVANHDWPSAEKYVDVVAVTDASVDAEVSKAVGTRKSPLTAITRLLAEAAKPKIVKITTEALQEAVEEERDWGAPAASKLASILAVSSLADVTVNGDRARVVISLPGTAITVRFAMARLGDYWCIVEVDDAVDLIAKVTKLTGVGRSHRPRPLFDMNALTASQVIAALKAVGVPITQVAYLTDDDQERLLDRPGSYVEKAVWTEKDAGPLDMKNPAGTVEIFNSTRDVDGRMHYLDEQIEGGLDLELTYNFGNALVRINGLMTPGRMAGYRGIFKKLR